MSRLTSHRSGVTYVLDSDTSGRANTTTGWVCQTGKHNLWWVERVRVSVADEAMRCNRHPQTARRMAAAARLSESLSISTRPQPTPPS